MDDAAGPILQTVRLGTQWPTIDPFLFCAHHRDEYPAGNGQLAPQSSLDGRQLGQDFAGKDGWNMYHGRVVPGFPQHPHRGFETISYMREGYMDHSDSLGAAARFGEGDVQWMTAGAGIVHAEMFPLFNTDEPNPLEMFQIWLNLPARNKMVSPHFSMLWSDTIPRVQSGGAEITVIAGSIVGTESPTPPPDSWAGQADSDVAVWHVRLDAGATWELPAANFDDTNRTLYLYRGGPVSVAGYELASGTGAVVDCGAPSVLAATGTGAELIVLQGRPIGEPVAQYGPFVMNDEAGIRQAMADYQSTQFGGWPWPDDDPVHGAELRRFARHADGRVDERSA